MKDVIVSLPGGRPRHCVVGFPSGAFLRGEETADVVKLPMRYSPDPRIFGVLFIDNRMGSCYNALCRFPSQSSENVPFRFTISCRPQ